MFFFGMRPLIIDFLCFFLLNIDYIFDWFLERKLLLIFSTKNKKVHENITTDSNPLIATPENCNLPINCNFFLQPNQAYYKSG